jgi:hypothetical protein
MENEAKLEVLEELIALMNESGIAKRLMAKKQKPAEMPMGEAAPLPTEDEELP